MEATLEISPESPNATADLEVVDKKYSSNKGSNGTGKFRNKSGNQCSYAQLITQAINGVDDKRLTLSEIYEWMSVNVPGLYDQRFLHSSKGWKNAVRHTLSINPRFCIISRLGRPGWWAMDGNFLKKSHTLSSVAEIAADTVNTLDFQSGSDKAGKIRQRHFTEPPLSAPPHPNAQFNFEFQVVEVLDKMSENSKRYVTVPNPLKVHAKFMRENTTQTDDWKFPVVNLCPYCGQGKFQGSPDYNPLESPYQQGTSFNRFLSNKSGDTEDMRLGSSSTSDLFNLVDFDDNLSV